MTRRISTLQDASIGIHRDIGSKYDNVKTVADNILAVVSVSEGLEASLKYLGAFTEIPLTRIDGSDIENGDYYFDSTDGSEGITYYAAAQDLWFPIDTAAITADADTASAAAAAALISAAEALTSKNDASTSASASAASASTSATNAAQTSSDSIATAADKVSTNADVISTAADAMSTSNDASGTAADLVQTGLDKAQTAADVISTAADASSTASDLVSTNSDAAATASDRATIESLYDTFDDRYLGTKTSDPTLDNDGNALIVGAMYFNSTENHTRFFNGAVWEDPEFTATEAASTATTKASEASTSASNASTSETNAGNSSTSASASAATSTTQAGIATNAASTATTKATESTASAAAALVSENNASTSAASSLTEADRAQAIADALEPIGSVIPKAVIDALREKRIRDSAGSGFVEWGKSQQYNAIASVNDGMWAAYSQANTLRMGRGHTGKAGSSRTDSPRVIANGVQHVVDRVGNTSESTYNNVIISFPPAPDGTKTYDSATGVVTQHASAAEAFEGQILNGDFRNGLDFWNTALVTLNPDATISMANNAYATSHTGLPETPFIAGNVYRVEVVSHGSCGFELSWTGSTSQQWYKSPVFGAGTSEFQKYVFTVNVPIGDPNDDGFGRLILRGQPSGDTVVSSVSVMPVTEQVITSRQDFVFLESFHEKIVGKDGSGSRRFHPLGNAQYGPSAWKGIALNQDYAQCYSAFGEWDTVTHGYSASWDAMNTLERELAVKDHENNIYSDDGDLIQVKYRIRVIEGLGDDWHAVEPRNLHVGSGIPSWLGYSSNAVKAVVQRASNISKTDWYSDAGNPNNRLFGGTARSEYDSGDLGTWQPTNGASDAHNGLCFAIPIALVQRRNQGAYHPSFNPNGSASTIIDGVAGYLDWNHSQVLGNFPINSTATAFTFGAGGSDRREGGSISNGQQGRPDGKFYDAIYASDVQDLRMSSRRVPLSELREQHKRKAIAGEIRGAESVPFTVIGTHNYSSSNNNNYINIDAASYKGRVLAVGDYITMLDQTTSIWETRKITSIIDGNQAQFLDQNGIDMVQGQHVVCAFKQTHKQANPTWTDIIGDPARIAATFPNGVEGQWIPKPTPDTNPNVLNRKLISHHETLQSNDNGASWNLQTPTIDNTNNTVTYSAGSLLVMLVQYETQANFTQDDVSGGGNMLALGNVWAGNDSAVNRGCLLQSSLIGKVGVNNTGQPRYTELPLRTYSRSPDGDTRLVASDGWFPTHDTIDIAGISSTVKTLDYLSEQDGVANLCFAYKEMVFDSATNGWASGGSLRIQPTIAFSHSVGDLILIDSDFRDSVAAGLVVQAFLPVSNTWSATALSAWILLEDGTLTTGEGSATGFKVWDGNGWGDNNQFEVVNNQSTMTDDNGNTAKVGTASFNTQYFIDESN